MVSGTWRHGETHFSRDPQRCRCRWLSLLVRFIENGHPSLFSVAVPRARVPLFSAAMRL